ncbi:MAG: histone deacetylase family protein [Verrucomicrobiales bacterium]|nr:histone deacetylase family protein [Verrucomicrobiales bacterium]
MPTAFLSHPDCLGHLAGPESGSHPDRPERLNAIRDRLISQQLFDFVREIEAPAATRQHLERVHDGAYLDDLFARAGEKGLRKIDEDTFMDEGTLGAALHAAGAVVHATDLVLSGEVANAYCNIRPPGHHATRDTAMGFCFINNIAAGVAHALAIHHLERVAVIDFDAHHGNGTESIFRNDSRVLTCSIYERNLYPDSLHSVGGPGTANISLEPGSGGAELREAVEQIWTPAMQDFQPEMIFVSAGFDAHADDLMSDLHWSDADYLWLSQYIVATAKDFSDRRLVSALEGGYDIAILRRCCTAFIQTLLGM